MASGIAIAGIVWLFGLMISLLATGFWIWVIVDCAVNEPAEGNDKIVWLLLIILLPFLGSLLYIVIRRPSRPIVAEATTYHPKKPRPY